MLPGNAAESKRKLIGGRWIRWDDERAADAYARGWWVGDTLADSLREAVLHTPRRVALIDQQHRLDCQTLYQRAAKLAQAMHARIPPTSVVSFMLPNWHEAAVIYLATTLAGMVANPILPSLRDRELRFILEDVDSRMIFVPQHFGSHDYVAMLDRVAAQPDFYAAVWNDVREALVPGFPYCVYYREEPGRVLVLSIFHTARDPSVWQGRA